MNPIKYIFCLILLSCSMLHAADTFTVVIDAGHGGKDPGAVNGKNQEKNINLNVALQVGRLIEENCKDVKVIYTRKNDVFVELDKRSDIANKAKADLFISIHTNSAKSSAAYGTETFLLGVEENRTSANFNVAIEENKAILFENDYETHYAGYDPNSSESQIIFEFMQNEYQKESLKMATIVQNAFTKSAKRSDRGVHQAGFLVLWKSAMPSILIELGFISNTNEMKYLTSQRGIEEMSNCIYNAFVDYLAETRQQMSKALPPSQAINSSHENVTRKSEQVTAQNPGKPIFKVQFLTSGTKLQLNDNRLKGLTDVEYNQEGKMYKYTCGTTTDYEKAKATKQQISKKYDDAFIIAFIDGKKVALQDAIKLSK
jgi:N-acetylmuramoyl-L-alanine amidase